jgi:hypothetical protein
VYYWFKGKQQSRRYVVPRNPRTALQERHRAVFGAASRAWSDCQPLTEEQRDRWYAEAAKIESARRLGTSGPLTAQQHFVGRNSVKGRHGLPLLLESPSQKGMMTEDSGQRTETPPQAEQPPAGQRICRPSQGRVTTALPRRHPGGGVGALRCGSNKCLRYSVLRGWRTEKACCSNVLSSLECSRRPGVARRNRYCRELWRGG